MLPSIGSISMPADVPHFLPSGSLPQFGVVTGTGLGKPAPVIGFPATVAGVVDEVCSSGEHPLSRTMIEANSVDVRTGRGEDIAVSLSRSRLRQDIPMAHAFHQGRSQTPSPATGALAR